MFGVTAIVRLALFTIIVLVVAGGFWYITNLKADLAVSQENTKKMTEAVQQQQDAIASLKADQESIQRLNKELNKTITEQQKDMKGLEDRFKSSADGKPRDFGKAAAEKSASIEKAVNRGTKNALRCIEIASGSPLTESEKNATTRETINRECPALANPNYRNTK